MTVVQASAIIPALRPYQQEAVAAISAGLAQGGRGQLHAACGSGKTLIGVESARHIVPGDGLIAVFVPSLSLAAQIIATWRSMTRVDSLVAVCSDDTVTDAPAHLADLEALDAQVTTDPAVIGAWLDAGAGRRLIVATYHSAHRVAEALTGRGMVVDLAVFDEAHHLAGRPDFATRRVLDDAVLPCRRRLFMTATPRIDDVRAQTIGALSMDDTTVFGPVLYSYPWARAISDGYLDDYRVVVMGVREAEVLDLLTDEEHVYQDRAGDPDLRTLAAQAVIAKAARQYGLRRILAFCPRLDQAREFAVSMPATVRRLPAGQRPEGGLHAERISGEMSHARREVVLERLRHPPQWWTVVTNVRCLSEGVDVPAVDAVAFTHPKRSQVDIVQAVGRALRRSGEEQGTATVIVPIVIPDSDEAVGDLDPGEFRTLWQVIRALRAHDETLGIELDRNRMQESVSNPQLPSRITIELPQGTSAAVLEQLKVMTVRQVTSSWWEGYGHARDYYQAHGDLVVPPKHVTDDGFQLGTWIQNARQHHRKGWMRPDRVAALEAIDMVWEIKLRPWAQFTRELEAFKREHGHVLVPQQYVAPSGYRLGTQVNAARTRRGRIPEQVLRTLDELGMVWHTGHLRWQQLYTACLLFKQEHGHLRVPAGYVTSDGYPLATRLKAVRTKFGKGRLDPAEQAALEELGLELVQNSSSGRWAAFLAACGRYAEEHGSIASVRRDYVDSTGYRLGAGIMYYRNLNNGTKAGAAPLSPDRKKVLDELGMVWRLAPARDVTDVEAARLRNLSGTDLAEEVIRLVDTEGVTQTSMSEALGMHRSHLNVKVREYREKGIWASRGK